MRKTTTDSMQVILQKAKNNLTSYRAVILQHSKHTKLYVVNITDAIDTEVAPTWSVRRHTYTKRARQLFKALVHEKEYCNMGKNDFREIGYDPNLFNKKLLPLLSKGDDLSFKDYQTWENDFVVPLDTKYKKSKVKTYAGVVPF